MQFIEHYMSKAIDIVGRKYGYLTVIRFSRNKNKNKSRYWECLCKCGRISEVNTSNLQSGAVKSCRHCKRSESKMGKKNPNWAGFNTKIRISSLHIWVKRRKVKPDFCEKCKIAQPIDLANISNSYNEKTYTRELKNWLWLCRRCHMVNDGRIKNLKQYAINKELLKKQDTIYEEVNKSK